MKNFHCRLRFFRLACSAAGPVCNAHKSRSECGYLGNSRLYALKTDTAFQSVESAVTEIAALRPAFMSVTYGAGGGASRYTLDMAKTVEEKSGVSTIAHLTCVSSTKETVRQKIKEMREYGIENVLALRGDLTPEMENSDRSKWDYRYAIDLIHELKESGADFCIGGACYPEVHPERTFYITFCIKYARRV